MFLTQGIKDINMNKPKICRIDIETYSDVDIKKCGVFKYVESAAFEILLISYRLDNGPVVCIDLWSINDMGPDMADILQLDDLREILMDPEILKTAYNAQFEITCLSKEFCPGLDPAQWRCTQVRAAMIGLPFGLNFVADVLKLPVQKFVAGGHIRFFCTPCKPTKANGMRTRNYPYHDPQKWLEFIEYNKIDVEVETQVDEKIDFFNVSDFEAPLYAIDLEINRRGIMIDRQLVENIITINKNFTDKLIAEAVQLTGLQNPKSVQQLKAWIEEETEEEIDNLQAGTVHELIAGTDVKTVRRVLTIRQQLSKSSISKYKTMLASVCADGRIHGLFQYYGANRTGRWAGRLVQVQNLVKNWLKDLDLARQLAREGDQETIELMYSNVSMVLSQLTRTAFVAPPGKKLIISDFSAIEARVLAWLAGEQWRLDVFNGDGKLYEVSAAKMFKKEPHEIKKGSTERDAGKVAELALGYQGSVGAMASMIATEKRRAQDKGKTFDYDPTEQEMKEVVNAWRAASPKIVNYWYDVNDAVIHCIRTRERVTVGRVSYHIERGVLFCTLPSGRKLAYMRPRLALNEKFGGVQATYEGMNQTTKKWERVRAYGGLFVENITQAIARDLLAEKIKDLDPIFEIVGHVHDEIIMEGIEGDSKHVDEIMSLPVKWAPGLPLKGDGFETDYYKKED